MLHSNAANTPYDVSSTAVVLPGQVQPDGAQAALPNPCYGTVPWCIDQMFLPRKLVDAGYKVEQDASYVVGGSSVCVRAFGTLQFGVLKYTCSFDYGVFVKS